MSHEIQFLLSLLVTVLLLVTVVWTGKTGQRKRHLTLVACVFVSLVLTVYMAERLGKGYDLEAAGLIKPVHLTIAKLAAGSYLLPLFTGQQLLRNGSEGKLRSSHREAAYIALVMTGLAAVTGAWMFLVSPPL